ncbi:hypothetical protein [Paenibacillus arenilitoris]|uniref:Uncharacterized protein n=1 Tax=Paenibacillus arenilitoris TaxID=2772299 RepID=A0A927CQT9_9BACL|nr:hypothetical protein [Paenibacillus arenilitoris]MBD2870561.1 hypothetical protein [Paenibacillus arenilitoris]
MLRSREAIVALFTAAIPFSLINFSAYLKGGMPDPVQVAGSLAYMAMWFTAALYFGLRGIRFLRGLTIYWGLGGLLTIAAFIADKLAIALPIYFIFAGPLYGIRIFLNVRPDAKFVLIGIAIVYTASCIGYLIGIERSRRINGC